MKKRFILSDQSLNSYGFRVNMSTLDLERFKSNPVMLHNHNELIGKWDEIKLENGVLTAIPIFIEGEEIADKIKKRVEAGFTKGASIGMHITDLARKKGETPLATVSVFECSICDIPSNANAIMLYDNGGDKLQGETLKLALDMVFKTEIKKKQPIVMKLNATSLTKLNLTEDASEVDIDKAINTMHAENERLLTAEKTKLSAEIKTIVDDAANHGKFLSSEKEKFTNLLTENFDLGKSVIEGLPKKKKLSDNKKDDKSKNREDWSFDDWRKKDSAGLLKLKADEPEIYKELLNA